MFIEKSDQSRECAPQLREYLATYFAEQFHEPQFSLIAETQRTLRAAARTGRLEVTFSSRSAFGRPIRLATRAAGRAFLEKDYRKYGGQSPVVAPLPTVPEDCDQRLRHLRRQLGLTQHELAHRVSAASKAVVYQWESRKRRPSAVFWKRVESLGGTQIDALLAGDA